MELKEIKEKLTTPEYDFLRDNPHLGDHIILLGLGGSYSYGTNIETSDLDVRGVATNSKMGILTNRDFEQVTNEATDTVIYSFDKIVSLLTKCNPNTIEMLGLHPDHYLYVSPLGQELIDNKKLFLSKKAINSFGGYANQQLYRLNQKAAISLSQSELEAHILKNMSFMQSDFHEKYSNFPEDAIKLFIDNAVQEDFDTEIFMDIHLTHYPLRDYASMWSELQNMVKQYGKIGKRNKNAFTRGKISKHMMHLVRLYYMCFDILEKETICTYRSSEHDLLMNIRNGKYLDEKDCPTKEFFEMVNDLEKRLVYAKEHTSLPESPDYDKINEFVASVNERIVKGEAF